MQGGLPYLAQPQAGGLGGPTTLQQGPPLLPANALPAPGASAASGLAAPVDTSAAPTFTSVVFDGYLSDCTVSQRSPSDCMCCRPIMLFSAPALSGHCLKTYRTMSLCAMATVVGRGGDAPRHICPPGCTTVVVKTLISKGGSSFLVLSPGSERIEQQVPCSRHGSGDHTWHVQQPFVRCCKDSLSDWFWDGEWSNLLWAGDHWVVPTWWRHVRQGKWLPIGGCGRRLEHGACHRQAACRPGRLHCSRCQGCVNAALSSPFRVRRSTISWRVRSEKNGIVARGT